MTTCLPDRRCTGQGRLRYDFTRQQSRVNRSRVVTSNPRRMRRFSAAPHLMSSLRTSARMSARTSSLTSSLSSLFGRPPIRPARLLLLLGFALVPATVTATVNAQGQPPQPVAPAPLQSQPSDSITRWAVNAASAGNIGVVVLLDAMDARVEPDGTGRRTMRSVVQVLQQNAVNGAAERRFSWQPGRQELRVDWVRVLRPDGTVISSAPSTDQSADATANMQNPMYLDSRTRRLSLSGVAPNTIVDVQYTVIDNAPWRDGDFLIGWRFTPGMPLRVSQLRVSVPESFRPRIIEDNLTFRRRESEADGRRTYEWRITQPQVVRPAPFAPGEDDVRMSVTLSAPQPWDSVSTWYNTLARDRYTVSNELRTTLDSIARGATTRSDSLRALHRWIAQDIRYVSVSLGLGGYQPRSALEVISTGYGDCKDKTSLFVAAARFWGWDARPVLLNSGGVRTALPVAISRFNHVIAAVAESHGRYTFTDLTASTIPYGELPASYRGAFGVVVKPDGLADTLRFPERASDSTGSTITLAATLTADGRMDMTVSDTPRGDVAWAMRAAFYNPLDSARQATGLRSLANTYLPESTADSLEVFDGRDFAATPQLRVTLRNGRGARAAGPVWLLHLPAPFRQLPSGTANTASELEAQPNRVLPIDSRLVIGPRTMQVEYRVRLPNGWSAQLPPPVVATSFFGAYESSYRLEGRELVMRRTLRGRDNGEQPAQRIAEVVAWMRAVAGDDIEYVTLLPG